ncbi:MAG: AAA family ATPase, partial [Clostridia bacterium]|nr:AAA family ATPase [Clostridia bacterium]
MRLKTLELQGFKSFADKTVLSFDRGVTAVVGPNGSGKSNISDAMRWVLGEISSKSIRGKRMEDVIFGGTDNRRPMGYAEVSLTIDNTDPDNKMAIDYDEVTVTRRYYRTGESEYMINRKPVRLKDITELFMNTGIGRGGYSIVGQGKAAEIISQKSDERRNIFEEAAGIAKYRARKNEAERKLAETDDNLIRINDILSELEGRVGPLEKDAAKARKYIELFEAKKALDVAVCIFDISDIKEKSKKLRSDFEIISHELEMADDSLSALETQSDRLYEITQAN